MIVFDQSIDPQAAGIGDEQMALQLFERAGQDQTLFQVRDTDHVLIGNEQRHGNSQAHHRSLKIQTQRVSRGNTSSYVNPPARGEEGAFADRRNIAFGKARKIEGRQAPASRHQDSCASLSY